MACSRPPSTRTSVMSGSASRSSASVWRSGLPAHAAARAAAGRRALFAKRIAPPSLRCLRLGGAVVAVGEREARLVLVGLEAIAAELQLLPRDGFEHLALLRHGRLETLLRLRHARAQALDRLLVVGVAVGRGLARAHERGVLRI